MFTRPIMACSAGALGLGRNEDSLCRKHIMKRYLPEWIPFGSALACVLFVVPFIANAIVASPVADGPLLWLKAGDYEHTESYFTDLQHRYEAGQLSDQQLYQG